MPKRLSEAVVSVPSGVTEAQPQHRYRAARVAGVIACAGGALITAGCGSNGRVVEPIALAPASVFAQHTGTIETVMPYPMPPNYPLLASVRVGSRIYEVLSFSNIDPGESNFSFGCAVDSAVDSSTMDGVAQNNPYGSSDGGVPAYPIEDQSQVSCFDDRMYGAWGTEMSPSSLSTLHPHVITRSLAVTALISGGSKETAQAPPVIVQQDQALVV